MECLSAQFQIPEFTKRGESINITVGSINKKLTDMLLCIHKRESTSRIYLSGLKK